MMSDWHVSASESEGEEGRERKEESCLLELGGLKIPAVRMLELLQAMEMPGTVELDCLGSVRRKRRGHRKKRHKRTAGESPSHGGSGVKSTEEISETTSDVRSTTSTNITAECRDTRRADFSKFDPSLDPELDDVSGAAVRIAPASSRKAPPNHLKEKKLASLDKIAADTIKRKQRWHQQQVQQGASETTTSPPIHSLSSATPQTEHPTANAVHGSGAVGVFNHDRGLPGARSGNEDVLQMEVDGLRGGGEPRPWQQEGEEEEGEGRTEVKEPQLPSFRFDDDEDSEGEMNSEVDMKHSILSQINRVENLLDSEALT